MNALAANTVEDLLKSRLASLPEKTVTLITKFIVFLYGFIIVSLAYSASSVQGPVTQMAVSVFGALGSPIFGMFVMGILFPGANKYGALAGGIVSITFNVFLAMAGQIYGRRPRQLPANSINNCPDTLNSTWVFNFTNGDPSMNHIFTDPNTTSNTSMAWLSTTNPFTASTEQELMGQSQYDFGFFLYDISYEWYSITGTFVCVFVGLIVSYLTRSWIKSPPNPDLLSTYSRRWCSPPVSSDTDISLTKVNLGGKDVLTKSSEISNRKEFNGTKK